MQNISASFSDESRKKRSEETSRTFYPEVRFLKSLSLNSSFEASIETRELFHLGLVKTAWNTQFAKGPSSVTPFHSDSLAPQMVNGKVLFPSFYDSNAHAKLENLKIGEILKTCKLEVRGDKWGIREGRLLGDKCPFTPPYLPTFLPNPLETTQALEMTNGVTCMERCLTKNLATKKTRIAYPQPLTALHKLQGDKETP